MAQIKLGTYSSTPQAPPAGYCLIYFKTDNVLYIQGSDSVEHAIGVVNDITDLHGDVVATGPGDVAATVAFVGGKSAAEIAQSIVDTQAATSANTVSVIVKRDSSGNVFVNQINGVTVEAHASRHLPNGADALATAAPASNLNSTSSNSAGSANSLARSDHSHAIDTGTPISQTPDQSNAAGTSTSLVKADHIHNIPTAVPSVLVPDETNGAGSASSFAKSDHVHGIPTAIPVSQTPDQSNAKGSSNNFARADHIHNIATDVAVDVGTSSTQGSSTKFSRADHVHKGVRSVKANSGTQQVGDLSLKSGVGATVVDDGSGNFTIDVIGGANELLVSYPGSGLVVNFTSGKVIFNGTETFISAGSVTVPVSTTNGSVYADIDGTVKAATVLPDNVIPLALFNSGLSSVTFLEDARVFLCRNLTWGLVGDIQTINSTATKSAGTSEKYARADHQHDLTTAAPVTQTPNQSNTLGSSSALARADHVHSIATAAPIADLTPASTNSDGSASTFSKSDHSHAIDTAAPVSQTPNQSNAAGSAASFAKSDHVHSIATAAPIADLNATTTNVDGSATTFSKSDHSHAVDTASAVGLTPNQSNGPGTSANLARADHVHNIPTAAPVNQIPNQANADGSATTFSKSDHIHMIPSGNPVQVGAANNAGSATTFSLADHVHAVTIGVIGNLVLTGYTIGTNVAIAATDTIFAAFGKIQAQINSIVGSAVTALTGDVSASGPGSVAATVNSVGGSSATNIHSAELAANAATSANTPSTIVKRDSSGNFSAGTVSLSGPLNSSNVSTAAIAVNTTSFVVDSVNDTIGLGLTPASNTILDAINATLASKTLQMTGYGIGSSVGTRGRFARGTAVSPAAAQSGDIINFWSARGYGASQFAAASTAAINAIAGETFTNASNLTYLALYTTPTGSVTSAESMRVASTGVTLGPQSASTAIHQSNGGWIRTTKTITSSYTVDTTTVDDIILCNHTAGITITLPVPTVGRTIVIKDRSGTASTNNITVAQHSTETIENLAASKVLSTNYGSWTFHVGSAGNWWLV